MGSITLTVLLLLCYTTFRSSAQTCEAFAGSPSYCCGVVNYDVFIPVGETQASFAASLLQELPERLVPLITSQCQPYMLLVYARTFFAEPDLVR